MIRVYDGLMKIGVPLLTMCSCMMVACGPAPNDPGPGGVTVGEAQALDEAAEMLDARNAPPEPVVDQQADQASGQAE